MSNLTDARLKAERVKETTWAALGLADDIRESLLAPDTCERGQTDLLPRGKMPVRFKGVYETWNGGYTILRIDRVRTPSTLCRRMSQCPGLARYLSEKVGKPVRLVCESDGEMAFLVSSKTAALR
jgi:hypothetical protein